MRPPANPSGVTGWRVTGWRSHVAVLTLGAVARALSIE